MPRDGPATFGGKYDLIARWVFSQRPMKVSVRLQVSARGGTGYISAVSMKLMPWDRAQSRLGMRRFAVLLTEGHGTETNLARLAIRWNPECDNPWRQLLSERGIENPNDVMETNHTDPKSDHTEPVHMGEVWAKGQANFIKI